MGRRSIEEMGGMVGDEKEGDRGDGRDGRRWEGG